MQLNSVESLHCMLSTMLCLLKLNDCSWLINIYVDNDMCLLLNCLSVQSPGSHFMTTFSQSLHSNLLQYTEGSGSRETQEMYPVPVLPVLL